MPPAPAPAGADDSLQLLLLCCHPALTPGACIPLALRAVAGLTTREIATAFLVPEATMAQRISRATARLADIQQPFGSLAADDLRRRLPLVLHVPYLLFNEGYAASGGTRSLGPSCPTRPSALLGPSPSPCPTAPRWRACSPSCSSSTPAGRRAPAPTESSCPSTARTAPAGTAPASPRVSPWSPAPWNEAARLARLDAPGRLAP